MITIIKKEFTKKARNGSILCYTNKEEEKKDPKGQEGNVKNFKNEERDKREVKWIAGVRIKETDTQEEIKKNIKENIKKFKKEMAADLYYRGGDEWKLTDEKWTYEIQPKTPNILTDIIFTVQVEKVEK